MSNLKMLVIRNKKLDELGRGKDMMVTPEEWAAMKKNLIAGVPMANRFTIVDERVLVNKGETFVAPEIGTAAKKAIESLTIEEHKPAQRPIKNG